MLVYGYKVQCSTIIYHIQCEVCVWYIYPTFFGFPVFNIQPSSNNQIVCSAGFIKEKNSAPHKCGKMSSKESTTTNSSDGGGTHHSSNSYSNHHHTRENRESVSRSLRSSTLPPSDRNMNNSIIGDHRGGVIPSRNKESLFLKESLRHNNKPGGSITMAQSIRSRSSGDGSSIGSSQSQRPMTVTYKSKTTTGMLFSKKTTSVDCGRFIKEPDGYEINLL